MGLRIVLLAVYPVLLGTGKRFPAKAGLRAEPLSFADGTPPRSFEPACGSYRVCTSLASSIPSMM